MATDRNIVFKVQVDDKGAITGLKSVTKGIQDIDLTSKNAKQSVDKLTSSLGGMGKGLTTKNIKLTTKELSGLQNQIGGVAKSSGAAAATTLELGRVISDAPYGIRGMANNVSQVASQIAFMSRSIDEATGKVVGFGGALKSIGKTMLGPLGVLLAIQAVIAAVDYFWGGMQKATEEVDNLNNSLDEQIAKFTLLTDFFNEERSSVVDMIFGDTWQDDLKILTNEFSELGKKIESLSEEDRNNEELVKKLTIRYKNLLMVRTQITSDAKELHDLEKDDSNEVGRMNALRERLRLNYLIKAELEQQFKVEKESRGNKQDRDKRASGVLTSEEVEDARVKQAENIDKLFQDKFELETKNGQWLIDYNKSVGEEISKNAGVQEAERLAVEKSAAEARTIIAQKEFEAKMLLLDGIGASLQAASEIAGEHTSAGKALAVAGATIDTFVAINKTLAATPGAAGIAQAVATGLFGFAQVKKILEVQVPNSGGGSGGSAPSSGRTFDFNLAGSTGQNQLAQTIGGQVQQPIKAYVVSSEITNQQQFDSQIQGDITIG